MSENSENGDSTGAAGDQVGAEDDAEDADGDTSRQEIAVDDRSVGIESEKNASPDTSRRMALQSHDVQFKLPPDASPDTAAAIAAALGAYLQDEREADDAESEDTWAGNRFQFAGRFESLTGTPRRIPNNAPTDGWTALGRLERL